MKTILIYLLNRMDFNSVMSLLDSSRHLRDISGEIVGRFLDDN